MDMEHQGWAQRATAAVRAELAWQGRDASEVAELLGIDKRTATARLNGGKPLDLAEIEKVAGWLGLRPSELLARASTNNTSAA